MNFFEAVAGLQDPLNWLYYGPPAALSLALGAYLAGWLKLKKGVRTSYTRKVFHIMNFTYAALIYLVGSTTAVVLFGGLGMGAMLICIFIPDGHILLEGIAREQDAPHRKFYVIAPFLATAIAGIIDNSLIPRFAVVGYLVSGWGDAAGEPVGARWGKHRSKVMSLFRVSCTRSIEGSIGVFCASLAGAYIALMIAAVPPLPAVPLALLVAGAGTLVEAVSSHGLDNLTVQMAAAFAAYGGALALGLA